MQEIDRMRFFIAGTIAVVAVFVLDVVWHGTIAADMYAGYPQRDMAGVQALFPFLFATYVVQLLLFCFLFLRLYPARGMRNAAWWGLWGGFFVMIPNMQFFVAIAGTTWKILAMQVAEGMILTVLTALVFEKLYRPRADA